MPVRIVRVLFTSLVSVSLALAPALPHAQAQAEPTAGSAVVAPAEAAAAVPPSATAQPAVPQAGMPSAFEIAYAQEVLRTQLLRQRLLLRNHDYRVPAVGLGLGVASLIIGGVVFSLAWRTSYNGCEWDPDLTSCEEDGFNQRGDRAGLVMMPVGALLILVNAPMLAVRLSRHNRLRSAERYLEQLSQWTGQISLQTPTRQTMGLTTRWLL